MKISSQDLVENGSLFGRAAAEGFLLEDAGDSDWRFVAIFAATSLEQVTKAALLDRNALLLAENNDQSLLGLAGVATKSRPRTIGAAVAISRYAQFNHRFGTIAKRLRLLLDYRNGVVHLAAEQPNDFPAVFDEYLRAIELVLEDLDEDEESFWGGNDLLAVVAARRETRSRTIEEEVERKKATATATLEARYQRLSPAEREAAMLAAVATGPPFFEDVTFQVDCSACTSQAWVGMGVDVDWEMDDFQWVPHPYATPTLLQCTVCGLSLLGDEIEVEYGDIDVPPEAYETYDFGDPPSYDDIPGLRPEDIHPYPPP